MSICAAHCSWVCCSKSTSRMTSYSSSVSRIGSVFSHPLGQNVSTCGTPQIRRHRGGLGMGAFLPWYRYISIIALWAEKSNFFKSCYIFRPHMCTGWYSVSKTTCEACSYCQIIYIWQNFAGHDEFAWIHYEFSLHASRSRVVVRLWTACKFSIFFLTWHKKISVASLEITSKRASSISILSFPNAEHD